MQSREYKLVCDRVRADALLSRLGPHLAGAARSLAYTRTTYLDTAALAFYASSQGEVHRRLRVRQYASAEHGGEPRLSGPCFLELKESSGSARRKWRVAGGAEEIARAVRSRGEEFASALVGLQAGDASVLRACLAEESVRAQVTTFYRREALVTAALRVTVDDAICFCAPELPGEEGAAATPAEVLARMDEVVVELKFDGAMPAWLADALAGEPPPAPFSKFTAAMQVLLAAGRTA